MSLEAAPVQVIFAPGTPAEFAIGSKEQLNAGTLTIEDMLMELKTQASDAPADKILTGLNVKVEISIGEMNLEFFRRATNPMRFVQDTVDPLKRKIEYGDLTGLRVPKFQALLKLYEGGTPTTNRDNWFTLLHAGIETSATLTLSKTDQMEYKMTICAYPDPVTGVKLVRGDITANG
jgi:hypothetical protein